MIPVTFVAQPVGDATALPPAARTGKPGGGICMLDVTGDGHFDLVVMGEGEHAIRVYHNVGDGNWKELSPQQTGLDASGNGISCAVGDFDNDGRNDLAVALSDRVLLFRNLGGGKFADVTKSAGIVPVNRPAGLTFVDFDHDGDLDLFVTGQPGQRHGGGEQQRAVAQQRQWNIYQLDSGNRLGWRGRNHQRRSFRHQ